jgi:hypothetical protein
MKQFHVTYFYLATGMEGIPDEKDYGIIDATTAEEAKAKVAEIIVPVDSWYYKPDNKFPEGLTTRQFIYGCLTAKEIGK